MDDEKSGFNYKKENNSNNLKDDVNALKKLKRMTFLACHFGLSRQKTTITNAELGNIGNEYVGSEASFVPMDNYCITDDNENMLTYGIGSCCGLFIRHGNTSFLMHISPINSADDILDFLTFLGLTNDSEIYIFPGSKCIFDGKDNMFNYNDLVNKLNRNNKVTLRKFNSESGSVYLLDDKLIINDSEPIFITEFNNSKHM